MYELELLLFFFLFSNLIDNHNNDKNREFSS
jgi:hypothetical protein